MNSALSGIGILHLAPCSSVPLQQWVLQKNKKKLFRWGIAFKYG